LATGPNNSRFQIINPCCLTTPCCLPT